MDGPAARESASRSSNATASTDKAQREDTKFISLLSQPNPARAINRHAAVGAAVADFEEAAVPGLEGELAERDEVEGRGFLALIHGELRRAAGVAEGDGRVRGLRLCGRAAEAHGIADCVLRHEAGGAGASSHTRGRVCSPSFGVRPQCTCLKAAWSGLPPARR